MTQPLPPAAYALPIFIPEELQVLHHCDIRHCFEYSHLYAGTPQDNMDDKVRRGRWRGNGYELKRECDKGHGPFTGFNVKLNKRYCKKCRSLWQMAYKQRQKEKL